METLETRNHYLDLFQERAKAKDVQGAIKALKEADRIEHELYGEDNNKEYYGYCIALASVIADHEMYPTAIAYYITATTYAVDAQEKAYCYYSISKIYDVDLDNLNKAAEALNTAAELYMEGDVLDKRTANCLEELASIYIRLGDNEMALNALKKSTEIVEKVTTEKNIVAMTLHNASKMCFEMRAYTEALDYLTRTMAIYEVTKGKDSLEYSVAEHEYKIVKAYSESDLH